ncbi:MAG: helix-turn-helix domain-containing protein [Eubacterium sp.]|nr:helix-turn-helix domain-containing protein [Eubacterium sp.]
MVSNQILQSTIDGLKEITKTDLCVLDTDAKPLASTFEDVAQYTEAVRIFAQSPAESQVVSGCQFFKVIEEEEVAYILLAYGEGKDVYMIGKIASFQVQNLLIAYKERFDKDNFIKNLLLDNLLLVDIYNRAKKLHIDTETRRVVFIIETTRENEGADLEKIREAFSSTSKRDFITAVDEKSIVLVKELTDKEQYEDMEKVGEKILKAVDDDREAKMHIAYGTIVGDIKEVSRSYKEARMALDVGRIFFEDRNIVAYNILGIGRLIYQLPMPLCKMFINEIFGNKSPDHFDDETIATINKFFENNLNVSETSRQLYIHRNTLVYRLDKLQKGTGLDLRVFEDAITFKIAMMVVKYMKHMENMDYS